MKKWILLQLLILTACAAFALNTKTHSNNTSTNGVGTESLYLIDPAGKTLQLKPGTLSSSFSLTLPVADGSTGQFLQTNGSGILQWGTPSTNTTPPGTIIAFAGSQCPNGYVPADGSSLLRNDYLLLFNAIGTTWGSVDGSHFNVPDLRNRYLRGTGTNNDSQGGDTVALGAYQGDGVGPHDHDLPSQMFGVTGPANAWTGGSGMGTYTTTNNTGNGIGNETRPKSYGVLYCISI